MTKLANLTALSQSESVKILGLMTGTSADGLDLCLVHFSGWNRYPNFTVLAAKEVKLPPGLANAFKRPLKLSASEAAGLSFELGLWYAESVMPAGWDFDLIASHGQTLVHAPPAYTLQIGEPAFLSAQTGKPVIFDFRTADVARGGQGAPLIPIVDDFLFRDLAETRVCLNLGGIANVTVLPTASSELPIIAWDTGPGNTLLDRAMVTWSKGESTFDRNGNAGRSGHIDPKLLGWLEQHPYFLKKPPKSAGQEEFGEDFFQGILSQFAPAGTNDWQKLLATLTEFTVVRIAAELRKFARAYFPIHRLLVSGGGVKNIYLMERLRLALPEIKIEPVRISGITTGNKEAFGFAYLGYLWLRQLTGNLPGVTGAGEAVVLGKLCLCFL